MQTIKFIALLALANCAPMPVLVIEGVPMNGDAIQSAIAHVNALQFAAPVINADVSVNLTIDYVERIDSAPEHHYDGLTTDNGPNGNFVQVVYHGHCVARSVLVHELIHVKYGDAAHKLGPMLWRIEVADINNHLITEFCPTEIHDGGNY